MTDDVLTVGPYRWTPADLRALSWAIHRPVAYWIYSVVTPAFTIFGFIGTAIFLQRTVIPQWFGFMPFDGRDDIVALPATLIAVIYLLVVPRLLMRQSAHDQKRHARNLTMTISAKGVTMKSETTQSEAAWAAFERIAVTRKHVFFFITQTQAYIVPKRAFANPEAATAFADTARVWQAEATRDGK